MISSASPTNNPATFPVWEKNGALAAVSFNALVFGRSVVLVGDTRIVLVPPIVVTTVMLGAEACILVRVVDVDIAKVDDMVVKEEEEEVVEVEEDDSVVDEVAVEVGFFDTVDDGAAVVEVPLG